MELQDEITHPAFFSGVGALVGYVLILVVLTVVVFGIPFILFSFL